MQRILQTIRDFVSKDQGRLGGGKSSPLAGFVDRSQLLAPHDLMRLGTQYGGWIIPKNHTLTVDSICYLAGAGEDISFDCALAKQFGCNVRIVDPTPRAIRHFEDLCHSVEERRLFSINGSDVDFYDIGSRELARMCFLPFGLADKDASMRFYMPKDPAHVSCSAMNLQKTEEYFSAQCYRLTTLKEQQGDTEIDLLKMDIEGGEYAVIKDLSNTRLPPRILLIEFDEGHSPLDNYAGERIRESIGLLAKLGMRCIALEGCNATFVRRSS
ncbi:MAG: FkbM family methyltransferase [Rhodoferax sp.]